MQLRAGLRSGEWSPVRLKILTQVPGLTFEGRNSYALKGFQADGSFSRRWWQDQLFAA
jgi:hypothetical protein